MRLVAAGARARSPRKERPPPLVLRFAVCTAVGLALAGGLILVVVRQAYTLQAERHAIDRARLTSDAVLASRLHAADLAGPVPTARRAQLDRLFSETVLPHGILAVTLYGSNGRITYATDHRLIGTRDRVRAQMRPALTGHVASSVAGSGARRALTTDVPLALDNGAVRGVIALSQDYAPIAREAQKSSLVIAAVLEALLLLLFLLLIPVLGRAARRLRHHLAELDHVATHDELLGLPNRLGLRRAFDDMLAGGERSGALLLVDLDGFREINEVLGSDSGDTLLGRVAELLQGCLPDGGLLARLGGDEFGVLLPGDDHDVDEVARLLREALADAIVVDGIPLAVDVTIGAALVSGKDADLDTVLRRASVALSLATGNGVAMEVYDTAHDEADTRRLRLTAELREALAAGQLTVYYQPQADLSTRTIRGVEALVRWQHPQRGLLDAGEFIPLAERTGLITDVGRFVLATAAEQWQEWHAHGIALDLAVNLAAVDLLDAHLPTEIQRLLERHALPPEYLILEITERTLLRDERRTSQVLEHLTRIGVRLAIDDYGTGYSSLSYLHRLPVQQVKLDRSFTAGIPGDPSSEAIVRSTVELAHTLNATVVAEGVETPAQWSHLAALGCDIAQGLLVGPPVPADVLTARIASDPGPPQIAAA